jgi:DNA recombination protein RmuC
MYHALVDAYDTADTAAIEEAGKALEAAIRKCARDIHDKYIEPPFTTDFAIMFLPVEGLYAEVVRRPGLFELLHRDYRVTVTGPSTLAAFLNSLQMGFRTLAIEKRSSEVWEILGAVKTEFDKFGSVLKKAQERITQAGRDIDTLVGTRTRQIQRQLRSIQELPTPKARRLLDDGSREPEPVEEVEEAQEEA